MAILQTPNVIVVPLDGGGGGGGSGTVTSVSVVSANGLAGTVATATTTPAITLSTTITGIIQGNGTAFSAASTTGTGNIVLAGSPTLTGTVTADTIKTSGSSGVVLQNSAGATVATFGSAATTNISFVGNVAMGANNLTMTGSIAATGARVTKGWFTDIESTNMPTVGGTSLSSTFSPIAGSASITTVGTLSAGSIPYSLITGGPTAFAWGASITGSSGVGVTLSSTSGATGALSISVADSSSAPTNAWNYVSIGSTQAVAHTAFYANLRTAAQAHVGYRVDMPMASTSSAGFRFDASTTGTGTGLLSISEGWNGFTQIKLPTVNSTGSTTKYGLYITNVALAGTGYGIYQGVVSNTTAAGYGIYQQSIVNAASAVGYGWYVGNLASNQYATGLYFSLNNAQSDAALVSRTTNTAEYLHSRTSTRTSGTTTDAYSNLYFKDTAIQNGAGGTFSVSGALFELECVATQTAGTLTHSKTVLKLTQDNDSTGGHILFNSYSGSPTTDGTLWFDGTNFKYRAGGATKTITAV